MRKLIFIAFLASFYLYSCQEHDTLDDDVIVGEMAPHAYWELGSSTVQAGDSVAFAAKYYTTGDSPIDHLEVWYDVSESKSKTVSCSWVSSFTYSYTSTTSEEKRINQEIMSYPHSDDYWSDAQRAYVFNGKFPTSNTLSSITWTNPETFDSIKMTKYFGADFMQHFKDSLYTLMKPVDFQKMYQGLNLVQNFKVYLDSTYNNNTGSYDYIFKNSVIPDEVKTIYQSIPFSDLIYNSSNNYFNVSYSLDYFLGANIKAVDKKGNAGQAIKTTVTLN